MAAEYQYQCKYWKSPRGCRHGARCLFKHDENAPVDNRCKYFMEKKQCPFGARCHYDHVDREAEPIRHARPSVSTVAPSRERNNIAAIRASVLAMQQDNTDNLLPSTSMSVPGADKLFNGYGGLSLPAPCPAEPSKTAITLEEAERRHDEILGINVPATALPSGTRMKNEAGVRSYAMATAKNIRGEPIVCLAHITNECPYGDECDLPHGEECRTCGGNFLHPHNQKQRARHKQECEKAFETDMNAAFAAAEKKRDYLVSAPLECNICQEIVYQKENHHERKFGLLAGCDHVFCYGCISQWRATESQEAKVRRQCPICRVHTHFIIPSKIFPRDDEHKERIIQRFKEYAKTIQCRNFARGRGECPFGDKCFYKHEYADGTIARDESPSSMARRRAHNRQQIPAIQQSAASQFGYLSAEMEELLSTLHEVWRN